MTRLFDICLSVLGLFFGAPFLVVLWILCWLDTGSPLFRQERVGRDQKSFVLVKFRTMLPETASVATHLVDRSAVTKFGLYLRRTKLDELPQLFNVIRGEMSLVGPRPCLLNQYDLIEERALRKVFAVRPGVTGLAQINGMDMSSPRLLAETDARMLESLGVRAYFSYIIKTVTGGGRGDSIR